MSDADATYTVTVDRAFLAACRAGSAVLLSECERLRSSPVAIPQMNERADVAYRHARILRQFADDAQKAIATR